MASKKKQGQRRKQTQTQKQACLSPSLSISKKKLWAFRFIALIIIPLILLSILELSLRTISYGYNTSATIKSEIDGRQIVHHNLEFGWRFFSKSISREFSSFAFEAEKSPQTYRVFVLGASAAAGVPEPVYNFGRFLEIMLQDRYPETKFEVVTVAMPAINSHAVLPIAKDCAKYNPDLFIVYLGNNEVVGPFGAGTVFSPVSPNLSFIRANLAIKATKTGQLLDAFLNSFGSKSNQMRDWGGMGMFLEKQVAHDSESLNHVYSHFESNLKDIIKAGQKVNAKIIVSNVACNLKDSPPFTSFHRSDLADTERQTWDKIYEKGIEHEAAGEFEQAIIKYLAAKQIDDTYADLQFRLGRCYLQIKDYQKAKECYIKAREYDTLRFRADARINTIIQTVTEKRQDDGVYFLDTINTLEKNSPHAIPGDEFFHEHVHYNFEGNYLVAKTILEKIEIILPDNIKKQKNTPPILTLQQCKDRFVYTDFEEHQIAYYVLNDLIQKPPFTNQLYHAERANELKQKIENLAICEDNAYLRDIVFRYNEKIRKYPTDWRLLQKSGVLLLKGQKKLELALEMFKMVVTFLPDISSYNYIIQILEKQGKYDEAAQYHEQLLKIKSGKWNLFYDYAEVLRKKEDYKNAIKNYKKSLNLSPTPNLNTYISLADSYNKSGNPQKALLVIQKGLGSADKNMTFNVIALFSLLQNLDQTQLAVDYYKQVLEVRPNVLPILNNLAWIQATCDDENIRNPKEAIELAVKACRLTNYRSARMLDTLAAAYASSGDFEKAVATAKKAARTANEGGQTDLAVKIKGKLRLYEKGLPYREKISP